MSEVLLSDDDVVTELKRLINERDFFHSSGNLKEDADFYESQDVRIVDCLKLLDGSNHIFVNSIRFKSLKANYLI